MSDHSHALSSIRVLDLTRLLPGPFCTMMLADLGAEVIKIEEPGTGEPIRSYSPKVNKESAFYIALNRNKKSITLNLKETKGREIFLELVKTADVVVEGFRPGTMDELDIDYETLKQINPAIIFCALSGYGQDGPWRDKSGHDINFLALSGILSLSGDKTGQPVIPGVQIADIGGGSLPAAFSILAAIISRNHTGIGQNIDIAMLDGAISWLSILAGQYFADGQTPGPSDGIISGKYPCYQVYETKDGRHMALGALEPKFWENFCRAIDKEHLIPQQFECGSHGEKVIVEMQAIFKELTQKEWEAKLSKVDCCCEAVKTLSEALVHPQVTYRKMVTQMDHPTEGRLRMINFPGKLSLTPAKISSPPPILGQHNDVILKEIGISDVEIEALKSSNII